MQDKFNPNSRHHLYCLQCGERTPHAEVLAALPCTSGKPHTHMCNDWVCTTCGLMHNESVVLPLDKRTPWLLIVSEAPVHEHAPDRLHGDHDGDRPNDIDLPFGSR